MTTWEQVRDLHFRRPKWSAAEIARALGCTAEYVRTTAIRRGWTLPLGKRKLSEMERQQLIDAVRDGEKFEALCTEFNVTNSSIRRAARAAGLPPRAGGWQSFVRPQR